MAFDVFILRFVGSPFLVAIGGEPSGRVTERIVRQKEAADVTHIGSQCELSLKIPGTLLLDSVIYCAKCDDNTDVFVLLFASVICSTVCVFRVINVFLFELFCTLQ